MAAVINARIEALYREHGHSVYSRCRALLGSEDEANDALQEVFVKVLRSNPSFDDDRPIMAWVNRVTTNHCLNRLRARKYRRHLPLDEATMSQTAMVDDASRFVVALSERRDLIRRLLCEVDERTQHVVVAYFLDDKGVDAVAVEQKISVPTVRRVLKRFLVGARKKLEAERSRVTVGEVQ
jgi:RNA polymerase sigma factor (sigma-70 family)